MCEKKVQQLEDTVKRLSLALQQNDIVPFSYLLEEGTLIVYNSAMEVLQKIPDYLSYLKEDTQIHPEDRWKAIEFYEGRMRGPIEVRTVEDDGRVARKILSASLWEDPALGKTVLAGSTRDITAQKDRESALEVQAKRDSLTMLYNRLAGRELINEYLNHKNPYAACGMMVVDIDYFKSINDVYGHLFGDEVLKEMAKLLTMIFDRKDILVRAGGDEFVIFVKDISHAVLVNKAMQLVQGVRKLKFSESSYSMTCSAGVCFLPENVSGYTYEQLFENADWALYRAKENGRNRYEFCDDLQRFELSAKDWKRTGENIDARYLRNDVIATAFEIFEKMNSFNAALEQLMAVIGMRFGLDRITVIRTDIKAMNAGRQYQWTSPGTPQALSAPGGFTKADFLTLFHSYDEYGTTVLQYDGMSMYSPQAQALLMQGDAKTVVYAAMYCEGKYTGAISYVVCSQKRYWSRQSRSQLGEITKIISAHLAKSQALNASHQGLTSVHGFDSLTGLLSFSRFREEVERLIVGGYGRKHMLVYTDFEDFKYFNQKYGYSMGDQVLKEFSSYVISLLEREEGVYFTRVVSDQFILFCPYKAEDNLEASISQANEEFAKRQAKRFPDVRLRLRSGIYRVAPDCLSASAAIDAANFARRQVSCRHGVCARLYDENLGRRQSLETEIINGMEKALNEEEFQVYLQPKFSLEDGSVTGAEALVRWRRKDGSILYPDAFIPLYERNGRIVDLDFYIFQKTAAFLAHNQALGRKQVPISVNISILHAADQRTVGRYMEILEKYGVDPSLVEIELTETATVSDYGNVRRLFQQIQKTGMKTSLDDFGAGYSVLNTVIDIPVNTVKIDRAFIANCESSSRGHFFLQQVVSLVRGLGYEVICEGVETGEQVQALREAGCEKGQGYWFSRPLSLEEYEKFMYGGKESRPKDAWDSANGDTMSGSRRKTHREKGKAFLRESR